MTVPVAIGVLGWVVAGATALAVAAALVVLAAIGLQRLWKYVLWPYGWMLLPHAQHRLTRRWDDARMRRLSAWALLEKQGRTLKRLHPILYRWLIHYLARTRAEARARLVPYRLPHDIKFPIYQRETPPRTPKNHGSLATVTPEDAP